MVEVKPCGWCGKMTAKPPKYALERDGWLCETCRRKRQGLRNVVTLPDRMGRTFIPRGKN